LTGLTFLSIVSNQLSGTIPSSLGALMALNELWLNDNQLNGTIPSSLGALMALRRLDFGKNQLSGAIPLFLGDLTALIRLFLKGNQLVGTMPFCNRTNHLNTWWRTVQKSTAPVARMLPRGVWQYPGRIILRCLMHGPFCWCFWWWCFVILYIPWSILVHGQIYSTLCCSNSTGLTAVAVASVIVSH
jgi:hypothetical protein